MARAEPNTNVRIFADLRKTETQWVRRCIYCSQQEKVPSAPSDLVTTATQTLATKDAVRAAGGPLELANAPIMIRCSPSRGLARATSSATINRLNTQSVSRVELSKPIVFGNSARYLGFTRDDGHTHEWTLYVRPYQNAHDLGHYIKKVIFILEPYYANEEVFQPPFEVKRTGWGEFDIDIKVIFRHRSMRALTLRHYLRLVEYDGPDQTPIYTSRMQSESYDEIVISRPSAKIKALFREETASPTRVYSTIQNRTGNYTNETTDSSIADLVRQQQQMQQHSKATEDAILDQHAARRVIQLTNILKGKKKVLAEIHRVKHQLLKNHQEIRALLSIVDAQSFTPAAGEQTSTSSDELITTQ
ncbi:YEATS domain-containing protein 4-like isoform X1 [Varroa destructor]|uniref:YEATS domain-containing protein n=1 Tax=Varroa destructor TaxID=109461 RepID=A0A7M7KNL0_VARDE|nr:YEATS domain-containing protein 4-like isoform X1 [Varroa destructor]